MSDGARIQSCIHDVGLCTGRCDREQEEPEQVQAPDALVVYFSETGKASLVESLIHSRPVRYVKAGGQ